MEEGGGDGREIAKRLREREKYMRKDTKSTYIYQPRATQTKDEDRLR